MSSDASIAVLLTMNDIISSSLYDAQTCRTVKIPVGALSCHWTAKTPVTFWYIKVNGSGNEYTLRCVENKVQISYSCTTTVHYIPEEGETDDDTLTIERDDVIYLPDEYISLSKVAHAYESDAHLVNPVMPIKISFCGEELSITQFLLPYSPYEIER